VPVLDASLVVSWLNPTDSNFSRADAWFLQSIEQDQKWIVPALLLTEVAAAIGRVASSGAASRTIDRLRRVRRLQFMPVSEALAIRAAHVAADQRIKGCDAVYVALAAELDDVLVTFDLEQAEHAAPVVRVVVPESLTPPPAQTPGP
jgi:predicted nucleic acid-binding protein